MDRKIAAAALVVCMVASAPPTPSLAAGPDPIDRVLDACLGTPEGETTTGQVICLTQAYDAWDKQLNVAYAALMEHLDAPSKTLLRDAQRQWLAYRDADRAFQGGPWTRDQGTLIRITLNSAAVDRVRARTQALRSYLGVFEEAGKQ